MRSFRSVDALRLALATALGFFSLYCGGQTIAVSSDAGGAGPLNSDAGPPATPAATPTATPTGMPTGTGRTFACVNPTPLLVGGKDTGFETCQGGTLRRRAVVDCPNVLPRDGGGLCPLLDAGLPGVPGCYSDSDCTMHPFGLCDVGQIGCGCDYGCVRDSDCKAGNICVCGDPVGQCEPASCNAGTCAAGLECADYVVNPGCPGNAFACQTASDGCLTSSDCPAGEFCTIATGARYVSYVASSGPRTCTTMDCVE